MKTEPILEIPVTVNLFVPESQTQQVYETLKQIHMGDSLCQKVPEALVEATQKSLDVIRQKMIISVYADGSLAARMEN